jgi:chromosome segregation protein
MIQFNKLRLNGFKSFVDKTELDIGPGLTGIVGPNGCGKSNLVEALRWSMGENSSKRMRGGSGSMEDVIFNGTERRPARNMAEVTLVLDNSKRTGPVSYSECDDIEVIRRIERDHGSNYKINGKNVRARDVQMLFADVLSGAHSPYLVSQGKVTTMIQAKPTERRMILEEAAGITGLYARRHEAELRLRATDNNLKRVEDLLGSMDSRLQSLKKQARQATKYRNLSAQIRQLEVLIACAEWTTAHEKLREIEKTFGEIESVVAEKLLVVTQLTSTQNVQSEDLPDLRQKDAELAANLQAQKLALQRLEDEAERLDQQIRETREGLTQTRTDREHEQNMLAENMQVLERLAGEERQLLSRQDNEDQYVKELEEKKTALQAEVETLENNATALMEKSAADRARKDSLERQILQDQNRYDSLTRRLEDVRGQLKAKQDEQNGEDETPALREKVATLESRVEELKTGLANCETELQAVRETLDTARTALQEQEKQKSQVEAEIRTLESFLKVDAEGDFRPVLEDVIADKGFETALSRALGDTLTASTDGEAPVVWMGAQLSETDLPSLPAGAQSLKPHVKAPEALGLALALIGYVENEEQGHGLARQLKPGQSLVSRDGAYWRWDGLHVKSSAADRHAVQLRQKNRLQELESSLPGIIESVEKARATRDESEGKLNDARAKLNETRNELQTNEQELRQTQRALNIAIEEQSSIRAELAKLEEALSLIETDIKALDEKLAENKQELGTYDTARLEAQQGEVDEARATLARVREQLNDAIRQFDTARQEQGRRRARLQGIGDERVSINNRVIRAKERLQELEQREGQLNAKAEELRERPNNIEEDTERLVSRISELEAEKSVIADRLAEVEGELHDTNKALKEAEGALSSAREKRASALATAEERNRHLEEIRASIENNFNMSPEQLLGEAAVSEEAQGSLEQLRAQREKAVRDRDIIGPVNLAADEEAVALETELSTLLNERNDLAEAINELRNGINKLNKEARERLNATFDHVNTHFQQMFGRLFIGGKAHLQMIESDDPLEAGLEIFAQPPGKALQSLSLLSGGEQTLTAMALIFAMFMTNPGPICVLDEVDAPLDDANVDRLCDVLQEFAAQGNTRFLVITHHRLTMARMDRLYGVTMGERGVSQLVSVDLNKQMDFLDEIAA